MKIAIILAGGVGKRMGYDLPKQFISIEGKPILMYTLESFQNHPLIDEIVVVCKEGWEDLLTGYAEKYEIDKLSNVIVGGNTAQESIRNGVNSLEGKAKKGDILIIHDGIRPLVDDIVLSDVIVTAQKKGNGVASLPYNEQIFIKNDEESSNKYIDRNTLKRVSTPQAYEYELIKDSYEKAFETGVGITDSSYANTMMADLGNTIYFAMGSEKNIKLTTKDDLLLFKGYLKSERS